MRIKRVQTNGTRESVWDYPRPPAVQNCSKRIRVVAGGMILVNSTSTIRVLETSHPPVYYIPPEDVLSADLQITACRSFCEWKGKAQYFSLLIPGGTKIEKIAWSYASPLPPYSPIKGYVAFYPSKVDRCYVDDEEVQAQEGDFYGGWITKDIVGPFKGAPGTFAW